MKRFDRRLLAGRTARRGIAAVACLGALQVVAIIAAAALLARIISGVFAEHLSPGALRGPLVLFGVAVAGRAGLIWLSEGFGHYVAAGLIVELRERCLRTLLRLGPSRLAEHRTGELATLLGSGLDRLDAYFARFVPQTIVAVVLPLTAMVFVATVDWVSAIILLVTVPLIPLFMVIIGWVAQRRTARRWDAFQQLGGHFLDVLQGLPTLRIFGRGAAQVERIRTMSRALRRITMGTLRIAFLSSFALELFASLGVALLAVTVAMRLVNGTIDLRSGLTVLILAPEVYLPLRTLAGSFHGSLEGMEAAARLLDLSEAAEVSRLAVAFDALPPAPAIEVRHVSFAHTARVPVVRDLNCRVGPGERLVVCGPSGAGKSTLLALLLGLSTPDAGSVLIGEAGAAELSDAARTQVFTWLPQRVHLFSGSIADNVRLGAPDASDTDVERALREVGASFVATLPNGIDALVGERGATLSGGQRQRIALARTLLRTCPIVLLDEPVAHLDAASRAAVAAAIGVATRGRSVVIAAHTPELFPWADRAIDLGVAARQGAAHDRAGVPA